MKSPAFQFYPDDFLGSAAVARMTDAEVGVYVRLLCYDWNDGGLPEDEATIARMLRMSPAKFARIWPAISGQFVRLEGRRFNPRLQKEREKQAEWRAKSSRGGKHSKTARATEPVAQVVENQHPDPKGGARVVEPPYQAKGVPNGNTPVSSLQSPVTTPATTLRLAPRREKRAAPKYPHFSAPVCDRLYTAWKKFGAPDYSFFRQQFGKLYANPVPDYPVEELEAAIRDAILLAQAEGGFALRTLTPKSFVERAAHWVEYGKIPLVDPETRWLTAKGERLTRPDSASA